MAFLRSHAGKTLPEEPRSPHEKTRPQPHTVQLLSQMTVKPPMADDPAPPPVPHQPPVTPSSQLCGALESPMHPNTYLPDKSAPHPLRKSGRHVAAPTPYDDDEEELRKWILKNGLDRPNGQPAASIRLRPTRADALGEKKYTTEEAIGTGREGAAPVLADPPLPLVGPRLTTFMDSQVGLEGYGPPSAVSSRQPLPAMPELCIGKVVLTTIPQRSPWIGVVITPRHAPKAWLPDLVTSCKSGCVLVAFLGVPRYVEWVSPACLELWEPTRANLETGVGCQSIRARAARRERWGASALSEIREAIEDPDRVLAKLAFRHCTDNNVRFADEGSSKCSLCDELVPDDRISAHGGGGGGGGHAATCIAVTCPHANCRRITHTMCLATNPAESVAALCEAFGGGFTCPVCRVEGNVHHAASGAARVEHLQPGPRPPRAAPRQRSSRGAAIGLNGRIIHESAEEDKEEEEEEGEPVQKRARRGHGHVRGSGSGDLIDAVATPEQKAQSQQVPRPPAAEKLDKSSRAGRARRKMLEKFEDYGDEDAMQAIDRGDRPGLAGKRVTAALGGGNGERKGEGLTPDWIIHAGCRVFGLNVPTKEEPIVKGLLDPCCNSKQDPNIPAETLYNIRDNGLRMSNVWDKFVILNPPFKTQVSWRFNNRAIDEVESGRCPGVLVVCRSSTDTLYFNRMVCYPHCFLRRHKCHFKDYEFDPIGWGVVLFLITPADASPDLLRRFYREFSPHGEIECPLDLEMIESDLFAQLLQRNRKRIGAQQRDTWIECCNVSCRKWRRISAAEAEAAGAGHWVCSFGGRHCADPEDKWLAYGSGTYDQRLWNQWPTEETTEAGAGAGPGLRYLESEAQPERAWNVHEEGQLGGVHAQCELQARGVDGAGAAVSSLTRGENADQGHVRVRGRSQSPSPTQCQARDQLAMDRGVPGPPITVTLACAEPRAVQSQGDAREQRRLKRARPVPGNVGAASD